MNRFIARRVATLALLLGLGAQSALAQEHAHGPHPGGPGPAGPGAGLGRPAMGPRVMDGHGYVLDNRYNHGHFYPGMGASVRVLPDGYHPYFHGGRPYYFTGGVWYASGGAGFVVVRPPVGLVIGALPPYYSTVWFDGRPYYYANDVYYSWDADQNGYTVVEPPANADQPAPPPPPGNDGVNLIIYPKNGQSAETQAADRYECHRWAKGQTGFDPSQVDAAAPADPGKRSAYDRAITACLTGRGYEVK